MTGLTPRWLAPVALILILIACGLSISSGLGARDSTHTMENVSMVVAQETWLRQYAGEEQAWLVTSNDFAKRFEKPPLLTWLHFIAWADLDPDAAPPHQLLVRARIVAVALGLLLVLGVYWLGATLGDLRLAILAALIAGAMMFLQRQSRTASYDIHFVSWLTLAVAASLWAVDPRGEPPSFSRRCAGALLGGLFLGCSILSKNPLPIALYVLPMTAAILLFADRRMATIRIMLGALFVSILIAAPWYVYVLTSNEEALDVLRREFRQPRAPKDTGELYYYLNIFLLVVPWTHWLIAGMIHPFTRRARAERATLLAPLFWLVALVVLFTIPEAKQQRYILPVVPAAALLAAAVWIDHDDLARAMERNHGARMLARIHWSVLLFISLAFAPFLAAQTGIMTTIAGWGITDEIKPEAVVGTLHWLSAILVTLILTAITISGIILHRRGAPFLAGVMSAVWALVFLGVYWHCYGSAPSAIHPMRAPTEQLAVELDDGPLLSLRMTESEESWYKLNEEFRFYFGRLIRHVTPDTIAEQLAHADPCVYVIAPDKPKQNRLLSNYGMEPIRMVDTDKHEQQQLWHYPRKPRNEEQPAAAGE
jgi:4-amino-4-deoxy-L-arabinose transferase-like glycosyltransferase